MRKNAELKESLSRGKIFGSQTSTLQNCKLKGCGVVCENLQITVKNREVRLEVKSKPEM